MRATIRNIVAGAVLAGFCVIQAHAKVGQISLAEAVKASAQIFEGKVLKVHEFKKSKLKVAKVEVVKSLRGAKQGETVWVMASACWTCDQSFVNEGETAVYLLQKENGHFQPGEDFKKEWAELAKEEALYFQVNSGGGHFPVVDAHVESCGYVGMPEGLAQVDTKDGKRATFESFWKALKNLVEAPAK